MRLPCTAAAVEKQRPGGAAHVDGIDAVSGDDGGGRETRSALDVVGVVAVTTIDEQVRDARPVDTITDRSRTGPRDRRTRDRVGSIGRVGPVVDVERRGGEAGNRHGALKGAQDVNGTDVADSETHSGDMVVTDHRRTGPRERRARNRVVDVTRLVRIAE
jgi:hypothetical protein